jgi:lipoprotein-anchoring transpeptidase ErfK/SrfK
MERVTSRFFLIQFLFAALIMSLTLSSAYAVGNTFVFNPNTLLWKAINEDGKVIKTGRGSGGKRYCADLHRGCKTPSGVFKVVSKGNANCRSSRYPLGKGGAPMAYCMFFHKNYAIHGSSDVPNFNASHGCVRVKPSDASWLSKNFIQVGTTVVIKEY